MINADMRRYDYYTYSTDTDEYGAPQLSLDTQGTIKIAIYTTSQAITDNINYREANYIGLTLAPVTDAYVIQYGKEKLKVLYIQPKGRYKQVYLKKI